MKSKVYTLQTQIGEHKKGSVAVRTDYEWMIGEKTYNTRGSISEGEMFMLLNDVVKHKFTSIIEPLEDEEDDDTAE